MDHLFSLNFILSHNKILTELFVFLGHNFNNVLATFSKVFKLYFMISLFFRLDRADPGNIIRILLPDVVVFLCAFAAYSALKKLTGIIGLIFFHYVVNFLILHSRIVCF